MGASVFREGSRSFVGASVKTLVVQGESGTRHVSPPVDELRGGKGERK